MNSKPRFTNDQANLLAEDFARNFLCVQEQLYHIIKKYLYAPRRERIESFYLGRLKAVLMAVDLENSDPLKNDFLQLIIKMKNNEEYFSKLREQTKEI